MMITLDNTHHNSWRSLMQLSHKLRCLRCLDSQAARRSQSQAQLSQRWRTLAAITPFNVMQGHWFYYHWKVRITASHSTSGQIVGNAGKRRSPSINDRCGWTRGSGVTRGTAPGDTPRGDTRPKINFVVAAFRKNTG